MLPGVGCHVHKPISPRQMLHNAHEQSGSSTRFSGPVIEILGIRFSFPHTDVHCQQVKIVSKLSKAELPLSWSSAPMGIQLIPLYLLIIITKPLIFDFSPPCRACETLVTLGIIVFQADLEFNLSMFYSDENTLIVR